MSKIELLNIDCMEYMAGLSDKAFDLAIVDPPYGIGDDGRRHMGRSFNKDGKAIKKLDRRNGKPILVPPLSYKTTSRYDCKQPDQSYFDELFRVSKKTIIFGENYIQFNQKSSSSGRIAWDKVNGETDQSDLELAWTDCQTSIRMFKFMWCGMLQGKSINEGHISQGNKSLCEKRIHPNHKPIALYKWLLQNYTKQGDKILDTHGGSRSLSIACDQMGFDHVSCEIDIDYHNDSVKRFNIHKQQGVLF
jgi:site-specific DNA-methyltransferase (adenine-specific)